MSLTDQQRAERQHYIGGSDAPALAGVNPPRWSQPIDVYLEKVGEAEPRPSSRMMAMGSLMESVVAELVTEAIGLRWRRPRGTYRSKRYPWAAANLDRIGMYDTPLFPRQVLLEAKWGQRTEGWGESFAIDEAAVIAPDRLEVPMHYLVQVQHYLAVTGRPAAILAVLLGYADLRWYRIWPHERIIDWLMELEETFWRDNVLARVPPEPDGSEAYGKHVRRLYADSSEVELVATPEQQALTTQLQQAIRNERAATRARAEIDQRLQLSMGPAGRLLFPEGAITWRRNRPTLKVQWEELATELLGYAYTGLVTDPLTALLPQAWPTTKKARAELVRKVARALALASEEPGARPWKPEFNSEEESDDASTDSA